MIEDFVMSGHLVDLALAEILLEALVLGAHFRATGRGPSGMDLAPNLGAGVCLLLAVRAALAGQSWLWIAAALGASLLAHLVDLQRRWGSRARRAAATGE